MKSRTAIISIKDLKADALPALEQALGAVPGVQSIDFNLERSVAVVEFEGEHTIVDDLMRAVLKAGYQVI
ncbi:MAG TPA: heavy metal-associated domain-containing protein [Candidatus Binatia bacterium]|nr:heavy metal-associated domain-containing protein [Candidatus Binatia bacterium]